MSNSDLVTRLAEIVKWKLKQRRGFRYHLFVSIPPINLRLFTQARVFPELIRTYMMLKFLYIYIKAAFLVYLLKLDEADPNECTSCKK
jgi:hypothetical protein